MPARFEVASGEVVLGAVVVELDEYDNVTGIKRLQ